jgi:hypothetical protein
VLSGNHRVAVTLAIMNDAPQETDPVALDNENRERAQAESPYSPGDLDLIRWALSLSLEERLSVLQDFVDTFWTPQLG